ACPRRRWRVSLGRPRNGRGQSHVGPLHVSAPSARRLLRRDGILSRSQAPLEPGGEALRGLGTLSAGPLPLVLRHLRASPAPVCVFWRLRALPCPFGLVLPRSDRPVQESSGSPADRRVRVSLPLGLRSALARASLLRGCMVRRPRDADRGVARPRLCASPSAHGPPGDGRQRRATLGSESSSWQVPSWGDSG